MLICNDLNALAQEVDRRQGRDNCWIFVNIAEWNVSPQTTKFYFIDEDEIDGMPDDEVFQSDTGDFLPLALKDKALRPWFESATLHGVASNASIPSSPNAEECQRFVYAANYYREYDDFFDYPPQG